MDFKDNLRYVMDSKDIQTKELAKLSGISENTLKSYLKEDASEPKISKVYELSKVLGVSMEFLTIGSDEKYNIHDSSNLLEIEKDLAGLTPEDLSTVGIIVKALKNRK